MQICPKTAKIAKIEGFSLNKNFIFQKYFLRKFLKLKIFKRIFLEMKKLLNKKSKNYFFKRKMKEKF